MSHNETPGCFNMEHRTVGWFGHGFPLAIMFDGMSFGIIGSQHATNEEYNATFEVMEREKGRYF